MKQPVTSVVVSDVAMAVNTATSGAELRSSDFFFDFAENCTCIALALEN